MKWMIVAVMLAASPVFAQEVDTCADLRASIEADFEDAADRASRAGQRRMNLFAMSSRADDAAAMSDVAEQAGADMAEVLLTAEKERRLNHKRIDGICSR